MKPDTNLSDYDVSILRPAICKKDIAFRGRQLSAGDILKVKKSLRTLHSLEIMATNIYRFQMTRQQDDLNKELLAAMCNEQTHISDFLVRLYEYGLTPGPIRGMWWIAGFILGRGSRILGKKAILTLGVWVENKAVHHYEQLLEAAPWDEATYKTIKKDQADEIGHIQMWKSMLARMKNQT
jgi:ubiquinone biosynthesis monooxygenase Coq7